MCFCYLQAAILLSQMSPEIVGEAIPEDRLYDAVNVILSMQVGILYVYYLPASQTTN